MTLADFNENIRYIQFQNKNRMKHGFSTTAELLAVMNQS